MWYFRTLPESHAWQIPCEYPAYFSGQNMTLNGL